MCLNNLQAGTSFGHTRWGWWPEVEWSSRYGIEYALRGYIINSSPPGQNGRHFPDDIFKCIFMNEKFCILIRISLKFVPKGLINNIPALVQIMAWRRLGDKPLSEPMLIQSHAHPVGGVKGLQGTIMIFLFPRRVYTWAEYVARVSFWLILT